MLAALKVVYDTLKVACERYTTRKSVDEKELVKYRKEIADLRKANEELLAEQATAMTMIEEMAQYLEKH